MQTGVPGGPPPIQPPRPSQNQYDFILDSGKAPKKQLFGGGKQSKLIMAVIGGVILLTVIVLIVSLISRAGAGERKAWTKIVQQQSELIRVSDIGAKDATNSDTKNLALNTKLTIQSQQPKISEFAKIAGGNISKSTLELSRDIGTDNKLETARQNNTFDTTFEGLIMQQLKDYRLSLQKVFEQAGEQSSKDLLNQYYKDVTVLIGDGS